MYMTSEEMIGNIEKKLEELIVLFRDLKKEQQQSDLNKLVERLDLLAAEVSQIKTAII